MEIDQHDLDRQYLLEQEMIDNGVARYQRSILRSKFGKNAQGNPRPSNESSTSYGVGIMRNYIEDISAQITEDTKRLQGRPGRKPIAYEYLKHLDHDVCALITCQVILDNISGVTPLVKLVNRIAGKLEDNTRLDIFKMQDKKYYAATKRYMKEKQKAVSYQKKRKIWINASDKRKDIIREWKPWETTHRVHIGNALLEAFIKVTSDYGENGKRIRGSGLVEKSLHKSGKKTKYMIQGTAKAAEWIRANMDVCQYFSPDYMPCIIPPKDWTSPTRGGYYSRELQKRKLLVKMQQTKYIKEMDQAGVDSCPQFYEAVNTLQRTAWQINTFVYLEMQKEFRSEHGIGMPAMEPPMEPTLPDFFMSQGDLSDEDWKVHRREHASHWSTEQKAAYIKWTVEIQKYKQNENERISKVLEISRTISIAKRFAYEDALYFVWTADFRSRLYSTGTAISPQGTDKSKGLLKFKNGKPLGERGLYHLCIHAAGVYGNDKCTLDDRVAWVMQNREAFIATYNNPESTRSFWGAADKPYNFLAVCEELGECLQLSTKGQQEFTSYIPCAQDGSCNGIQHYSAMLRDPVGAAAVNLVDSLVPSDIYMQCANKVIEYIHYSINNSKSFNGKEWIDMQDHELEIAEGWLDFGVVRDCTKKPTMVIPYGGTKIGCRDDCRIYLDEYTKKRRATLHMYDNPFKYLTTYNKHGEICDPEVSAITWLHHLVWHALDEVVVAARVAMKFLRDVTKPIVKAAKDGCPIHFTTETGFVIHMEIKKAEVFEVKSHLEGRICLRLQRFIDKIDTRRMQTSIAPNFVHGVCDATHLQKTVCLATEMGVTDFAMIHDSYGTHAGDCDKLHRALRYTFYDLHKENLLVKFWQEQVKAHPELINDLPSIHDVDQGDFDISSVLNSTHFFR